MTVQQLFFLHKLSSSFNNFLEWLDEWRPCTSDCCYTYMFTMITRPYVVLYIVRESRRNNVPETTYFQVTWNLQRFSLVRTSWVEVPEPRRRPLQRRELGPAIRVATIRSTWSSLVKYCLSFDPMPVTYFCSHSAECVGQRFSCLIETTFTDESTGVLSCAYYTS
jgi:hypothetical protein